MGQARRPRIVFISKGRAAASTRYRALQYMPLWREAGWHVSHVTMGRRRRHRHRSNRLALAAARRADITVVLRRCPRPWMRLSLAHAARQGGGRLVFDFDDAIFLGESAAEDPRGSRSRRRRFNAMVRQSDLIWAGNTYLAEAARRALSGDPDGEVHLLSTGLDASAYPAGRPASRPLAGGLRLIWIGGPATRKYVTQAIPLLEDAAAEFAARRLGPLSLEIVADAAPVHHGRLAVSFTPWNPQAERLGLSRSHVGIAPMPDDAWTRGKCGFKVLQYMAAGLPVVADASGDTASIVEAGASGLLVHTPGEWINALLSLAVDPQRAADLGARGREIVASRYDRRVLFVAMWRSLGLGAVPPRRASDPAG